MSQTSEDRKKIYDEQDKEITDLQTKYNADLQEVLNAVIDADNDLEKAEEYLKKRQKK
jgi:translation elongation factor EF-Ts